MIEIIIEVGVIAAFSGCKVKPYFQKSLSKMIKNRVCHQFFIGKLPQDAKKRTALSLKTRGTVRLQGEKEGEEEDYATFSNFLRMAKMKSAETRQMPASTLQMTTRLTFAPHIRPGIMTS